MNTITKHVRSIVKWCYQFNQKVDRNEATAGEMLAVVAVGAASCLAFQGVLTVLGWLMGVQ